MFTSVAVPQRGPEPTAGRLRDPGGDEPLADGVGHHDGRVQAGLRTGEQELASREERVRGEEERGAGDDGTPRADRDGRVEPGGGGEHRADGSGVGHDRRAQPGAVTARGPAHHRRRRSRRWPPRRRPRPGGCGRDSGRPALTKAPCRRVGAEERPEPGEERRLALLSSAMSPAPDSACAATVPPREEPASSESRSGERPDEGRAERRHQQRLGDHPQPATARRRSSPRERCRRGEGDVAGRSEEPSHCHERHPDRAGAPGATPRATPRATLSGGRACPGSR